MKSPFLEVGTVDLEEPGQPLVAALRELRQRHDVMGCVLVSFDGATGRVAVNTSGFDKQFGAAMDRLGKAILGAIDDGNFDPAAIEPTN